MQQAAIYARYSSDMQRSESIEAQIKAVRKYAANKNYHIVEIYADEALTGKNDKRPAFQRMLADAKMGRFPVLLVHKTNRFGRNKDEISYFKYKLKKAGVKVVFVAEDFGDGHHAVIMESFMEGMAEFYSLELATETMKGLLTNADHCKYNGGHILYGYQVNDEQLYEINPEEAPIVAELFERVAKGHTYQQIIDDFGRRGITRRGKPWRRNSIYDTLRNEKYTGVYIFNKTSRVDASGTNRNWRKTKDDKEIVKIPGGMPQIVTPELFYSVQAILDGRKDQPRGAVRGRKFVYLLTGLMECGECGAPYIGENRRTRGKDYPHYCCSTRRKEKTCENINLDKHKIESQVIESIRQKIQSLDDNNTLQQLVDTYNEIIEEQSQSSSEELQNLQQRERELESKTSNIMAAIEAGGQINELTERLKSVSQEKELVKNRQRIIQDNLNASKITVDDIRRVLNDFQLTPEDEPEKLKEQIHRLVVKIIVKPCGTIELEDRLSVRLRTGTPPRHQHVNATLIEEIRRSKNSA